ncbi:MAG: SEC59/DGK1/VTE5 family protein [Methanimicrococcus sp.]|nr:SEC59/DGK1/VTE5 family protein [Methanimicrococcus sp.]
MQEIQNTQEEKVKSDKYRNEVSRKLLHMCSFLIVIFIYFVPKWTAVIVLFILFLVVFIGNFLILNISSLNNIKIKYFSFLLRDSEKAGYISSNWFLLGCALSVLLFSKHIAMLGISILIFADAFAALVGMKFGKHKFKNGKSFEGSAAFIVVSYLFTAGFYIILDSGIAFTTAALLSAPLVAVIEIYSKQIKIDDNLTIPISFGVFMTVFMFLGQFL